MKSILTLLILTLSTLSYSVDAQNLPQPSPNAEFHQTVGLTKISVLYSRPGVKERTIFGDLVPYDKLWRTGANGATIIQFSEDVVINEEYEVAAGRYALLTIPSKDTWIIIINKDDKLRGTGNYKESEDLVRFSVDVENANLRERMAFEIEDMTDDGAMIRLHWEKTAISFFVGVETSEKAMANIEAAIQEREATIKSYRVYSRAAQYCLNSKEDLPQGLKWIDMALEIEDYWYTHYTKAKLLAATKDYIGAIKEAAVAKRMGQEKYDADGKDFTYGETIDKDIKVWTTK